MDNKKKCQSRMALRICAAVLISILLAVAIEFFQNVISHEHQYEESLTTLKDISQTMENNENTVDVLTETYHNGNVQLLNDLKELMTVETPEHVFQSVETEETSRLSGMNRRRILSYAFLLKEDGTVILSNEYFENEEFLPGTNLVKMGFFTSGEFQELISTPEKPVLCAPEKTERYYFYATPVCYESTDYYLVIANEADVLLNQVDGMNDLGNIVDNASIRAGGIVLAINPTKGIVTYCSDDDLNLVGKTLEEAGIPTSSSKKNEILTLNGENYIIARYCYSDDCELLEAVSTSIRYSNNYKPTLWAMMFFAMTMVSAIFYILNLPKDMAKNGEDPKLVHFFGSKFVYSRTQIRHVAPFLIWGLVLIFGSVFYCRTLLRISWAMSDVERPLTKMSTELTEKAETRDKIKDYCDQLYVTKAQMIASMLEIDPSCLNAETTKVHTEYTKDGVKEILLDNEGNPMTSVPNSEKLMELCDSNDIRRIMIFNDQGYVIASSDADWSYQLSLDSDAQSYPFREVLDGKKETLIQDAKTDDEGNENQYIGVAFTYYTTTDDNGNTEYVSALNYEDYKNGNWDGNPITAHPSMLQCAVNLDITEDMMRSTDIYYILDHISLTSNGYMVGFDDTPDHKIVYTPNARNMGKTAAELNISDNEFSGNFNGFQNVEGVRYFECCRYSNGYYIAVATPVSSLYSTRLLVSLEATGACLIAMVLIMAVFLVTTEEELHSRETASDSKSRWGIMSAREKSRSIVGYFMVAVGVYFLMGLFTQSLFFADSTVIKYVLSDDWEHGLNIFAFTKSLAVMIGVLVGLRILDWITRLTASVFNPNINTAINLLLSFVRYAAVIVGIFYCLSLFGLQPMSLLASAGILTVILGLGAQSLIADLFAGVFMVFEGSFHVGELVVIDGNWGYVEEIGIRTTKLRDLDNSIAIYKNNNIKNILNVSVKEELIRMDLRVYHVTSLKSVEQFLNEELPLFPQKIPELLEAPYYDNVTLIGGNGTSSCDGAVDLRIVAKCHGSDRLKVIQKMNRELLLMCEKHNARTVAPKIPVIYSSNTENSNK